MTLGELLKSRREALGMTLEDVADSTSSSKSYVWELENGKGYKMSLVYAARFAVALGLNANMMACAALESARAIIAATENQPCSK